MLPTTDPAVLLRTLGPLDQCMIVLDFDGTLAPIVPHYEDAALHPGAGDAIDRLAHRTRVVVSSGRDVDDLRARIGDRPVVLVGGHGARIVRGDETLAELADPHALTDRLDSAEAEVTSLVDGHNGWLVERKPTSLAIHFRTADDLGILDELRRGLSAHVDASGELEVLEGKAIIEMRSRATNKGRALEWLLAEFGGPTPIVIGDDVTDEDAFAVALRAGGTAIRVGDASRTLATSRLPGPDAVVELLSELAAASAASVGD